MTPAGTKPVRQAKISFLGGREVVVRLVGGARKASLTKENVRLLQNPVAQRGLIGGLGVRSGSVREIAVIPQNDRIIRSPEEGKIEISEKGINILPQIPWTLVLRGGVFKGLSYIALFKFLKSIYSYPSNVFTTSTGAVFGAPFVNGMDPVEMERLIFDIMLNPNKKKGVFDLFKPDFRGMRYPGSYKGFTELDALGKILNKEFGLEGVTFNDIEVPLGIRFFISVVNLGEGKGLVACAPKNREIFREKIEGARFKESTLWFANETDCPVVEYVIPSASIPVAVKPGEKDGRMLVDGGVWDVSIMAASRIKDEGGYKVPVLAINLGYTGARKEKMRNLADLFMQMIDVFMAKGYESVLGSYVMAGRIFRMINPGLFNLGTTEVLDRAKQVIKSMMSTLNVIFHPFMNGCRNAMDAFFSRFGARKIRELKSNGIEVEKFGKMVSLTDKYPEIDTLPYPEQVKASKLRNTIWLLGRLKDAWGWGWTAYYAVVGIITSILFIKKNKN